MMTDPDPDVVTDRASFFAFVRALIIDRRVTNGHDESGTVGSIYGSPGGWENHSIGSFLEAALAWAETTKMGVTQGLPEEPTWRGFAAFLYCGKIYE